MQNRSNRDLKTVAKKIEEKVKIVKKTFKKSRKCDPPNRRENAKIAKKASRKSLKDPTPDFQKRSNMQHHTVPNSSILIVEKNPKP
jgi:hypothetical protein